ncbi:hypothetical protein Cob_v003315 [Colletotrichum orbiculare MAFF 240422]|uniref:Uncharacterized protein n=1 Tax=Colletotrichum orbiculare (strain 104-T / ATCC 96160 / CBS 514.97 / LARS 414 / MAFF 240422) TaxID=1213857 RepID=A0A484G1L9_COLOR|nr:hypothetical protein Cob_v003315 [Colletotrichum orbiculare MAFF 240422]
MSSPSSNNLIYPSTANTSITNPNNSLNNTNSNKPAVTASGNNTSLPMPGLSGPANGPVGNLLKGPVDDNGKLKDAGLMVGIKLDLEAEVHLTARVRGDILVGLY